MGDIPDFSLAARAASEMATDKRRGCADWLSPIARLFTNTLAMLGFRTR